MKLYLIRHGETVYNREKRYQGQRDIPLSEEGRAATLPGRDSAARGVYFTAYSRGGNGTDFVSECTAYSGRRAS